MVQASHHQPLSPPMMGEGNALCIALRSDSQEGCQTYWYVKKMYQQEAQELKHFAHPRKEQSSMCIACWRREGVTFLLYFTLLYFTLLYFTLLYFTLVYFTPLYFALLCDLVRIFGSFSAKLPLISLLGLIAGGVSSTSWIVFLEASYGWC